MTSLYRLDMPASAIAAAFGAEAGGDPWMGDYVAPGRPAPVIVSDGRGGSRRWLRPKLWGVPPPPQGTEPRSEEHTSELQSLMRISYAVFCLKKKTIPNKLYTTK